MELWWKVVVQCPDHPVQPDKHVRYVIAQSQETAEKKAVSQFRGDHWYTGAVEIIDLEPLSVQPATTILASVQASRRDLMKSRGRILP
jgi:hypothetical protein